MATVSEPPVGVEFIREDGGQVTARHVERVTSSERSGRGTYRSLEGSTAHV